VSAPARHCMPAARVPALRRCGGRGATHRMLLSHSFLRPRRTPAPITDPPPPPPNRPPPAVQHARLCHARGTAIPRGLRHQQRRCGRRSYLVAAWQPRHACGGLPWLGCWRGGGTAGTLPGAQAGSCKHGAASQQPCLGACGTRCAWVDMQREPHCAGVHLLGAVPVRTQQTACHAGGGCRCRRPAVARSFAQAPHKAAPPRST